ncbi:hypothetical protein F4820DRAFT_449951 [Hypoxylon rubiginosum]|uniref:Uncharacterized protein n=1 Tax=Hypoxylon rubiginosum TaxID=110542 RepID=A0ACB9YW93_9PEZI|nr:hypothetical protein F4820DRAFT_449951 [Hypoxylon rubiginosum]
MSPRDRPPTPEPTQGTPHRAHYSIEVEITPVIRTRRAMGSTVSQQRPHSQDLSLDLSEFLRRRVQQGASTPPRSPKGYVSSSLDGIQEEEEYLLSQTMSNDESSERSSQVTTRSVYTVFSGFSSHRLLGRIAPTNNHYRSTERGMDKFVRRDFASLPSRKITFSINDADLPSTSVTTKHNHYKRLSAPPVLTGATSTEGPITGVD